MRMKSLFIAAALSFSTLSMATDVDCHLESLLTKQQLHSLKSADGIKRIGLNKVLLGDDAYRVQILNNKENNQLVVFLGETHIKGPRSSIIGKKITEQYNVRTIEGIPREESEMMRQSNPDLYASIGWKRKVMQIITLNPFDSTIGVAVKHAKTLNMGELSKRTIGKTDREASDSVKSLIESKGQKVINIPMEYGETLVPNATDDYILNKRNVRMANNIKMISSATKEKGNQLVIVGYAHLPGLKSLLEENNFESCRLDF